MATSQRKRPKVELFEDYFDKELKHEVARVAIVLASNDPTNMSNVDEIDERLARNPGVVDARTLLSSHERQMIPVAEVLTQAIAELTFEATIEPRPNGEAARLIGELLR